ncbi:hypothetical protein JM946_17360 [Steroidobacter sp. S1-65]|uniref:Uncharacterized protein n=1 Tax=Steroidobacter gossypii TaxID=2805490 RepID=A0ABS1WZT9_9GAMM|nr:hypothetical protein [Steroidobacter gossypii]MBM0106500.1 hypothetical protein [Steroidobacter gossypii]
MTDLLGAKQLTLIRQARLIARSAERDDRIWLAIEGLPERLPIRASLEMRFGTEIITAATYLDWVIERGDEVDIIVDETGVRIFWIHIAYRDTKADDLRFSEKDDGLFALRTKAGEKAQRQVARTLRDEFQHCIPAAQIVSPGCFEITYAAKKKRTADLICESCRLKVEVKKRNRDRRFRISHSQGRPFWEENNDADWHAFVFPDRSIHWVSNATISAVLAREAFKSGSDQYDAWVDLPSNTPESPPPHCRKPKTAPGSP